MSKKEFGIKLGDQSKILNKEEWSRHGIIYSTTGTNLDLYLTYIQEQLLNQKSGFIYINCVPDIQREIQIQEVCKSIGREQDFYCLEFNNNYNNKSNSINIFNENKEVINDDLKNILNQFAEDYGIILNSSTPDITIYDVIKNNKVLYISLPGTATQEQKELLGKSIVKQIYIAYENIVSETQMKVPYTIFLDDYTKNYVSGDMLSQLRSKCLAFYFIQSFFCEGIKNISNEIEANVENKIVLKIYDPRLIKRIIENSNTLNVFKPKISDVNEYFYYEKISQKIKITIKKKLKKEIKKNDIVNIELCECFTKDKHNKFIKNDFYSVLNSSIVEITKN